MLEELAAVVVASAGGSDAELGNVGNVVGDAGTENHGDEGTGGAVAEDPGVVGFEDAAAGEADDVVEEAERAVEGAVLVVDEGVDVAGVGLVDELGCSLVGGGGPAGELDVLRKIEGCGVVAVETEDGASGQGEVVLHEEAGVHGETGVEEDFVDGAGVVEEELGFDAVDVGGIEEQV